jgi:long-chain acyl-CoA synthetase
MLNTVRGLNQVASREDDVDSEPARRPIADPVVTALRVPHESVLAAFHAAVEAGPDQPAIHYFDETMTWGEVDQASDALASLLVARGFEPGDRMALCVQNNPAFTIGLIATWKARGIAAIISPMSKSAEFARSVTELEPRALLCLDELYEDVAREVLDAGGTGVQIVVTVSPMDFQARDDRRIFPDVARRRTPAETVDLARLVAQGAAGMVDRPRTAPNDVAVIAPTSGTTGDPKGAMLTHQNLLFSGQTYRECTGLRVGEPILAMSPLFHVTGLVAGVILGIVNRSPVVLTHRFDPLVIVDAVRERMPVFTVAAITAYKALAAEPSITAADLSSLRIRCSGGLPIEPHVVDELDARLGGYIHNVYGQTETASPSHVVPFGRRAPVDPETGVLSVGLPVPGTVVSVVDGDGRTVPTGDFGEIITSGPQVMLGYWRRPGASADALAGGAFATGDIGFTDEDGWFYVVDRSSDVINAAGYKIWPFEVEQVLASHPAVREVAVVDIADDYRGQSVRAYVALEPGHTASPAELIEYSRDRLAAYKYPREVEIVDSLPRTATGKLLRRRLRES